jgi:exonuclease III
MSHQIKNIYCWNANSISNKFEEIILALNENDIDILAINETKINKIDEYFIKMKNLIVFVIQEIDMEAVLLLLLEKK